MTTATSHQASRGSMKALKAPRAGCNFLPFTCQQHIRKEVSNHAYVVVSR
jgi:hypothetical protein